MKKVVLLLVLSVAQIATAGDLKVVTRRTSDAAYDRPSIETNYFHGEQQRQEFHSGNFTVVTLYQCDLHRIVSLDEKTKTYRVTELDERGLPKIHAALDAAPTSHITRSGNKVIVVEAVVDTGERKDFSGLTAKHLIKTTRIEPQQTSCSNYGQGRKVDGWYIETPAPLYCAPRTRVSATLVAGGPGQCWDDLKARHSGPYVTGIPVQQTTASLSEHEFTTRLEPVEISQQPLDPKLFEIPPDYTEYSAFDAAVHYYWEKLKDAVARIF